MQKPPLDILCLDLATHIGVARWQNNKPHISTYELPQSHEDVGLFLHAYHKFFHRQLELGIPDVIVFEAPWVGKQMTSTTAKKLFGLAGCTELFCREAGIREYFDVKPNTWRKHFTGVGSGKREDLKLITQQKAAQVGFEGLTEDEADALGILDYTLHCFKITPSWACGELFTEK